MREKPALQHAAGCSMSRRGLLLIAPAAFEAGCALTPEANTYVDAARQLNRRVEVVIATNLQ